MKNYHLYFTTAILLITLLSCRRELSDPNQNQQAESIKDLNIPIDFNWETNQSVEILVNMPPLKGYQPKSKISVFNTDPAEGGRLYLSGSVSAEKPFRGKISLPQYSSELVLVREGPFGSVTQATVPIEAGVVSHTFSTAKSLHFTTETQFKQTNDGPDCNDGCDEYISGGGNVQIKEGKTYCIDDAFDGKLSFQNWNSGGTVRICGTAVINNNQYITEGSGIVVAEGGVLTTGKNIEISGGTITIYQNASVELDDLSMGSNAIFTVYENAEVDLKKIDAWGTASQFINYGSVTIEKDSYHSGDVENYGTLEYEKKLEINAASLFNAGTLSVGDKYQCYGWNAEMQNDGIFQASEDFEYGSNTLFTNNGTVEVEKDFDINDNAGLLNNGTITVNESCNISTNGNFTNNCSMFTQEDINFSGGVKVTLNTGYLKADQEINFWINNSVDINNSCMISCEDMAMECDMNGTGDLSSVVVTEDLEVWNSSDKFSGAIEVATTSGEMSGGGDQNFADGAYLTSIENAVNYLPVTACNPDGFGTPTIVDMDFDGVPDTLDAYPDDPLRAFNSYFPDDQQYATVAFEDLWPSQGDYDFNDLVMAINASYVTNANDLLVDLKFDFTVLAVGASLDNGFGFQYESLTPDKVASVTGMVLEEGYVNLNPNGTESGQSKVVVIATESINDVINRPGGSFFNTVPENPQGTSDTIRIVMTMNEPVDPALVDLSFFNPFIIKSKERNVEIHLPGYAPTDLMDNSLFGTFDDASNPVAGVYYVTTTNLPWAMFLVEPFHYPVEKAQITDAYNYFGAWAESGGTVYNDWYLDYSGYRNANQIY